MTWYCLQVKPRQEPSVDLRLRMIGIDTYLPLIARDRRITRHKGRTTEPMFPGYILLNMDLSNQDIHPVLKTVGVQRMVSLSIGRDGYRIPTPLPAEKVEFYRTLENEMGINTQVKSDYAEGDEVRFKHGPFRHYSGTVEKLLRKSGEERAMILMGELVIEAKLAELEPA